MRKLGSNIVPIALLGVGLAILIGVSSLITEPKTACLMTLAAFIVFNVTSARFFGMMRTLRGAWGASRLWHFLPGLALGLIPIGTAYVFLFSKGELPTFKGISLLSALLTLATVSWEEAWFRGISLELAASRYSTIGAALVFGLIFALLHIMNPKIDLFQDGIQLFAAGYTLSVCYFVFESIWAPIGMHFANNLTQALFGMSTEPRSLAFNLPLILISVALTLSLIYRQPDRSRPLRQLVHRWRFKFL